MSISARARNAGFLARVTAAAILAVAAVPALPQSADLWDIARTRPHIVIVMRHAETHPGNGSIFDPSGQCRGEQMLTPKGREDATAAGRAFASQGLGPARLTVVSSAMCRTRDTALLAFGKAQLDPALREVASASGGQMNEALDAADAIIRSRRGPHPLVVVTHLPNIDAMTGEQPPHHEAVVAQADERGQLTVLGRVRLY